MLAALLPIFKILIQIKNNNEDESFRFLIGQSEPLADGHRLKIVQAHAMIQFFKKYCRHLHFDKPAELFLEMLDNVYCQELMFAIFEPR